MVEQAKVFDTAQRVQVEMERHLHGKRLKIRVENYDSTLGWYTSGSMVLPLQHLPLLEQSLEEMRAAERNDTETYGQIIPFPGMSTPAENQLA